MKCKRCGCEDARSKLYRLADMGSRDYGNWYHEDTSDCVAALKAKLAKMMTSEPTKPERFPHMRETIRTDLRGMYTHGYFIEEFKEILAAYDKAVILMSNEMSDEDAAKQQWLEDYGPHNLP